MKLFSLVLILFSKVMTSKKKGGGKKREKKPVTVYRMQNKNISKMNVQIA